MTEHGPRAQVVEHLGALVRATRHGDDSSAEWSLESVRQRVWVDRIASSTPPTFRLTLSTDALGGFTGLSAQLAALSALLAPPRLAGLVRSRDAASRLEFTSSLHASEQDVKWATQALAVAADMQAEEARSLQADREAFTHAGLTPACSDDAGSVTRHARTFGLDPVPADPAVPGWTTSELCPCIATLRSLPNVRAVQTPWGVSATIWPAGPDRPGSILEVRADARRSFAGKGLSVVLRTAIRGGPLRALGWNEREVGPRGRGNGLGGWWAAEGGFMVHSTFYPDALKDSGRAERFLLDAVVRAHDVEAIPGVFS
jgi:hypothetical protein